MPLIARSRPDVALLDLHMRDGSGVTVCRRVRSAEPSVKGLLLTAADDGEALLSAAVAGAHGYVLKEARTLDVVAALRSVGGGDVLLEPATTDHAVRRLRRIGRDDARLTDRERRVLEYVVAGLEGRRPGEPVDASDESLEPEVADLVRNLIWTSARPG